MLGQLYDVAVIWGSNVDFEWIEEWIRTAQSMLEIMRGCAEEFDYGDYKINESVAKGIFRQSRCGDYLIPRTAYLRYRVDGKVVEKRFDLSSLNPNRVHKKTVEFYVDGEVVEVGLVTRVEGNWPTKEVIDRQ